MTRCPVRPDPEAVNPFQVPMELLDAVHVPSEEQVEAVDVDPPVPDITSEQERQRLQVVRSGGGGF